MLEGEYTKDLLFLSSLEMKFSAQAWIPGYLECSASLLVSMFLVTELMSTQIVFQLPQRGIGQG